MHIFQNCQRQVKNLRSDTVNAALQKTISTSRLQTYLAETGDNLDLALSLYERNTRLAESFYTPLQILEVCFRNTLDNAMCNVYGADWFRNGRAPLSNDAKNMIAGAYDDIRRPDPVPAGAVVAELKFAFWVGLLGPAYDATLWRRTLHRAFIPRKKRSEVHGRFNAIRRFRNRIAHHEPIFKKDLTAAHAEIIEAIGWMCPATQAWAAFHSRVISALNSD